MLVSSRRRENGRDDDRWKQNHYPAKTSRRLRENATQPEQIERESGKLLEGATKSAEAESKEEASTNGHNYCGCDGEVSFFEWNLLSDPPVVPLRRLSGCLAIPKYFQLDLILGSIKQLNRRKLLSILSRNEAGFSALRNGNEISNPSRIFLFTYLCEKSLN